MTRAGDDGAKYERILNKNDDDIERQSASGVRMRLQNIGFYLEICRR